MFLLEKVFVRQVALQKVCQFMYVFPLQFEASLIQ